jgi:NAD(P)-dependent dehydrogenase (short-subunit alcohol dehydrogenase family)
MGVSSSKPHPIETKWFPEYEETLPSLDGKTVAITGTTSGTGFIVARTALKKGAENVLMLNRPSSRSEKAEDDLRQLGYTKSNLETIPCDLQDFESVKKASEIIKSKYKAIDVLCCNAGVMALEDKATKDGYDVQIQTNNLSHFMLIKDLMPLLKKAVELRGSARIAHHSSGARNHPGTELQAKYFEKNGGDLGGNGSSMLFGGARWQRYHQTKLGNSVITCALNDKLDGTGIEATVAEPGLAATNLQVTTAGDGGMGSGMFIMRFAQSAEDGSMPICSACFDPKFPGKYSIWKPEGIMTGKPVVVPLEKLSTDEKSREMLWQKCVEACGEIEI